MKKIVSLLLVFSYIVYWQGGPGTEIRYMKDYGEYTINVEDAKKFDTAGEANQFQINHSKIYKDKYEGFHMGLWYIKEVN